MKLLADANIEAGVIAWLREVGHDVTAAADLPPGTPDDAILALANSEERALLSHDLDFGELVYRKQLASQSIFLLRTGHARQSELVGLLTAILPELEKLHAAHVFAVIASDGIRIRSLPPRGE